MGKKAIITLDWSNPFSFLLALDNPNEETECLLTGKSCVDFRKDMKADQVVYYFEVGIFCVWAFDSRTVGVIKDNFGISCPPIFWFGWGWLGGRDLLA